MEDQSVTRLIGVYNADGGLLGEVAYVWARARGTRHCALCDITHGRVRRRPEWDRMVADLRIPVDLLHLNEIPPDVRQAVVACGAPVVLAQTAAGLVPLVDSAELDALDGSVARLGDLLRARLPTASA
ncbi:hypothetical protein [Nocardioides sp. YIM 152588]|uniref:hypothetical protein n=1 Tax=Nocardioides sp. YIM 152588 TaxID=3158259 RepID=UPI0032E46434